MSRAAVIGASLFSLMLILVACAGPAATPASTPISNPKSSGPVKATWIEAKLVGDTISVPAKDVQNNIMSHFKLGTSAGEIAFMAYELDGKTYVRASICPPCQSDSFSLQKDTLVCDRCATVFNAKTGSGIKGACVAFPKASVSYETNGGDLVMKGNSLITAYVDTLKPGRS